MSIASARRSSRDSERRRRMLGKAETPEHQRARYAADPEPQRAACRDYYQANRDQILAGRARHYAANRKQILAAKAARYQAGCERTAASDDQAAALDQISVLKITTLPTPPRPARKPAPQPIPAVKVRRGQYEAGHVWAGVRRSPVLLRPDDMTPLSGATVPGLACPDCAGPAALRRFEGQAVLLFAHAPGCRAFRKLLTRFAGYRRAAGLPGPG